jgi:hypothetical protein
VLPRLDFSYDEEKDVLTIEGIPYPGMYFRSIARRPPGELTIYTSMDKEGQLIISQRYTPNAAREEE